MYNVLKYTDSISLESSLEPLEIQKDKSIVLDLLNSPSRRSSSVSILFTKVIEKDTAKIEPLKVSSGLKFL